jgi:hypothetical protein
MRTYLFFFLPFLLLSQAGNASVKLIHWVASTRRRLQLLGDVPAHVNQQKRASQCGESEQNAAKRCKEHGAETNSERVF